ncbi:uncharacterized protein J7T54_000476 [Emericellopsis cladophorae]|uniref:Uncharacterized protein n=1 Tax=Emericellopsis cladophorae TaxID=2686198 RepID=A0A9P9XVG2_9HYPO|nr:uncharacterized protein J7T54_000476 [Emericellopsis cladophorae]KAI6778358.1 hypothetical protein J7T54_000476 [Emericellopsis cladophorae]
MVLKAEVFDAISRILNTVNGGVLWKGAAVPGPRWKWSIGQFKDKFMNGRASSEEWCRYGPVYRIWAGAQPEIVLTTPEDIRTFHTDSAEHGKPLNVHWGWFFGQLLGRGVGLISDNDWKNLRRIVDPPFRHSAVVSRAPLTNAEAKRFVDTLGQTAITGREKLDQTRFSIHAATSFMKFPFFFASEVIYGRLSDSEKHRLWELAEKRLALTPYLFKGAIYRTPWFKWWNGAAYRQLRAFTNDWSSFNKEMASTRKEQGVITPISSYYDELQQGSASQDEILHTIDEMLFANLDVTTHVITWFVTLVAEHLEVKQALREEVEANKDNMEEYIAKTNTHLHRCFYESLRLRPLTIFSIGESAQSVKNFRGILVKPKTMVLVDTLAINVRNPFWGSDRNTYNPDRFKTVKQTEVSGRIP